MSVNELLLCIMAFFRTKRIARVDFPGPGLGGPAALLRLTSADPLARLISITRRIAPSGEPVSPGGNPEEKQRLVLHPAGVNPTVPMPAAPLLPRVRVATGAGSACSGGIGP